MTDRFPPLYSQAEIDAMLRRSVWTRLNAGPIARVLRRIFGHD